MTDKRLAEMRNTLERSKAIPGEHGLTLGEQYMLMREVDRLRVVLDETHNDIAQAMLESGYPLESLPDSECRELVQLFHKRLTSARAG